MHLSLRLKLGVLFAIIVIGVCVRLGIWQLERAEEKVLWLDNIASRQQQPPIPLTQALETEGDQIRVRLQGKPDNSRHLLLDNRIHQGVAGYYVITPVQSLSGEWVLLNRGWLPRGNNRQVLPTLPALPATISVVGQTYQYSDKVFTLAEDDLSQPSWPLRIQKVDIPALSEAMSLPLLPFEIRAAAEAKLEQHEQLVRPWNRTTTQASMGPEKHRAYAAQWFTMAIAFSLIIALSLWRGLRTRTQHSKAKP